MQVNLFLKIIFPVVASFLLFSQCTVIKRQHRNGFYVSFKNNRQKNAVDISRKGSTFFNFDAETKNTSLIASADSVFIVHDRGNFQHRLLRSVKLPGDSCDIVTMKNGDEIKVSVTEVGTELIKYRNCNDAAGQQYSVRKQDVFRIKYHSGKTEVIGSQPVRSLPEAEAQQKAARKFEPRGIIALAVVLVSLFLPLQLIILAFVMSVGGILLAIHSLNRISNAQDKWKGGIFGIIAIAIGVIVAASIVVLLLLA